MRYFFLIMLLLLLITGKSLALRAAEKQNYFIITGPQVTEEHFQRFVFFFSIESNTVNKLFVRVFDADFGGALDMNYAHSRVHYLVYGGQNVMQDLRKIDDPLPKQPPLTSLELGENSFYDNRWRTIAALNPRDGRLPNGQVLFQLVVDGKAGPGSNKFQVFISADAKKNSAIPGLRLSTPAVNVQVPDDSSLTTELRFSVPATSQQLKITNFDADTAQFGGRVFFSSLARPKVLLKSSKDKQADLTEINLLEQEKGKTAALLLSSAKVNYVQLWVTDDQDRDIFLDLPPFLALNNHVPQPKARVTLLSRCNTAVLDASETVDKDNDQLSYTWRFADGSVTTGSRITHDFQQPGNYTAHLTIEDTSGFLANQAEIDVPVTVNARPTAHISAPIGAAPGETVRFDGSASTDTDGTILRYHWAVGKKKQAQGPVFQYSFAQPGVYPVRLLVKDDGPGPCTTDQAEHNIFINARPVAACSFQQVAAPGQEVVLDAGQSLDSDGTITAYTWNFGEQGASALGSGKIVQHVWQKPGLYTVQLQVKDDSGLSNSTDQIQKTIRINAAPEPVITASSFVVAANVPVNLRGDKSRDVDGKITLYRWNFGDSTAEQAGKQVSHVYTQPGLYTLRLTLEDDSGVSNAQQFTEQQVRVNAPPKPVITMPQLVNTSEVTFDAAASSDADDKIIAYTWDFGDGSTAQGVTVSHLYPLPGRYTVQLKVTDASGTVTGTQSTQQEIRVNMPPVADAGPDQVIAQGDTVHLNGNHSVDQDGLIASFIWQVQGKKYTGKEISHRFEQPGQYQVGLTVVDNDGARQSDVVTVTVNSQPLARMQVLSRVEPGKEILFDASESTDADGSLLAYTWDFGDGQQGKGRQAKHTYAKPGRYQAVLTVQDNSGATNDRARSQQTVAVNFPPKAVPGKDIHTCKQFLLFDGSASTDPDQDPLAYSWDFGDNSTGQGRRIGHQFKAPGLYPVRLQVDDNTGLGNSSTTEQITVQINHPPEAIIRTDGEQFCLGEHVLFDGSLSRDPEGGPLRYLWDLGDGQQVEGINPVRVYEKAGDYPIHLTVLDDSGLKCNTGQARKNIHLIAAPVAQAGQDIEVCSNSPVAFDGTGSRGGDQPIISYQWNFGDNSTGVGAKVNHIYREPGLYTARLTIKTPELTRCDNHAQDVRKVRVRVAPQVDFKASNGCVGEVLTFDASETATKNSSSTQYSWDFGDSLKGQGSTATHSYTRAGTYTVRLTAQQPDNTVCSSSEHTKKITINHPPVPRIRWSVAGQAMNFETPQAVLPNTVVHFSAAESKDRDGVLKKLLWDFGDGEQAQGWFVTHSFTEAGQYTVRLTVEDDAGVSCSQAQTELPVVVMSQPSLHIQGPTQVCVQQDARYVVDGPLSNAAQQILWDFGRGLQGQGREETVRFTHVGTREINTVIDGQPGPAFTVQVRSLPELVLSKQRTVFVGEELRLRPLLLHSTGIQPVFQWQSSDGTTAQGAVFRHTYTLPGTFTVQLSLRGKKEQFACQAVEKEVTVTVLPLPKAEIVHQPEQIFSGGARDEVFFHVKHNSSENWLYRWDFGDKSKAKGAVVSHVFEQPGTYTVTLTLIDGKGIASQPYHFYKKITVHGR
ncbi:MAG: PKD domain-containing protein [Candidatus Electrothrix sp. AW1]|nr:PKD domain-containing protein [Candidatus Electrothrix gigas]